MKRIPRHGYALASGRRQVARLCGSCGFAGSAKQIRLYCSVGMIGESDPSHYSFGGSIISFERSLIQRSVPQILHHATLTVVPK